MCPQLIRAVGLLLEVEAAILAMKQLNSPQDDAESAGPPDVSGRAWGAAAQAISSPLRGPSTSL